MRRGQIAIEFIMLFAFAILIGLIFLLAANNLLARVGEDQRRTALDEVGYAIQDEIILATQVQDGYARSFLIPARADRFAYTITSTDTAVQLTSGATTITYHHPTIVGTLAQGYNTITKIDGVVEVNP